MGRVFLQFMRAIVPETKHLRQERPRNQFYASQKYISAAGALCFERVQTNKQVLRGRRWV